jgi:hypothetical protein
VVGAVGRVKTMSRVKSVPPIDPLMFANGNLDGIDDAEPAIDVACGIRPVAATEYPPAAPSIDLIVGFMPVAPLHVIAAVPRPSGILVRRARRAPADIEISATMVAPAMSVTAARSNTLLLTVAYRESDTWMPRFRSWVRRVDHMTSIAGLAHPMLGLSVSGTFDGWNPRFLLKTSVSV